MGLHDAPVGEDNTPALGKNRWAEVAYIAGKEVVQERMNSSGEVHLEEGAAERNEAAFEGKVHAAVAISKEDRKTCVVEKDKAPR